MADATNSWESWNQVPDRHVNDSRKLTPMATGGEN